MLNGSYDIRIIALILIIAIVEIIVYVSNAKKWQEKLVIILLLGGTTIYSGIGISMPSVDKSYILIFALFLLFEGFGLHLGHHIFKEKEEQQLDYISYISNSKYLISAMAIIYWIITLILLVYPENHLSSLFSIRLDITGVIESRISKRTNLVVYTLGLLSKIISPFYCIYLSKQRKSKIIILLLLEAYINTAIDGYIGRTAIMMLLVEVILILLLINSSEKNRKKKYKITLGKHDLTRTGKDKSENQKNTGRVKQALVVFAVGFVIAIPFLVSYQFTRHGQSYSGTGFMDSFFLLFDSEINYPKYYSTCESLTGNVISPIDYAYWFLTLPIPKELFSLPSATTITYSFSSMVRGISFGQQGFSVLLTSLMGEGILLWGKSFCLIHALFLGTVWGAINSFLTKHRELFVFQILFIARTLNMVRGGTQGSMATIINGIIPFVVICYVIFNISTSKSKRNGAPI